MQRSADELRMLIAERHIPTARLLARRGMCDLDTLSAELSVSQSTVRRDVEMLEQGGLVERTHGGVIWIGEKPQLTTSRPYAFDQRMNLPRRCQAADRPPPRLVQPGQTVLIDGGTTTFYLAGSCSASRCRSSPTLCPSPISSSTTNSRTRRHRRLMYPRYGVLLGPTAETPSPPSTPRPCSSASPASTPACSTTRTCCWCRASSG